MEPSKKFFNRWADIFIKKMNEEGYAEANMWAQKMFTQEQIAVLIPIIQEKRNKK